MPIELHRPKTILLPVDGSMVSAAAGQCAHLIAQRFGSNVVVLNVLEPLSHPIEMLGEGMFEHRSRAQVAHDEILAHIREQFPSFQPEITVQEGDPAEVIARTAAERQVDLIVMATRGKGPFRRFLLGSTAAKILNDVPVPVLTTTHTAQPGACNPTGVGKILCPLALDERSRAVCRAASLIAAEYRATLTLLHVLENPREDREKALARLREISCNQPDSADVRIESGSPDRVICGVAHSMGADLVVIGRSSPGPLGRLRAQSYGIIRESPCPGSECLVGQLTELPISQAGGCGLGQVTALPISQAGGLRYPIR